MKQIIIFLLFCIWGIALGFAQASYIFKILNVETISAYNIIVSCRDDYGRTIQFQAGSPLLNVTKVEGTAGNPKPFKTGQPVIADFGSKTVSIANDNTLRFKIINPTYSQQYGSIEHVWFFLASLTSVYASIAVKTNANKITGFKVWPPASNGLEGIAATGLPVYKKYFKNESGINKSYAILKPSKQEEINNNIIYSYEADFTLDYSEPKDQKIKAEDLNKNKPDIDNSLFKDKPWEIKPNPAVRGATGKLFLDIPKDAECVITISQPVTERQVSYSINERSFSLVPGTFDVTISGSKVKDVPVQKEMDTRIKAGILNVVASGTWTLYDEKKDRQIYYSVTAKKIGLPIGTYQMDINGTMQQILIKDGETVDF